MTDATGSLVDSLVRFPGEFASIAAGSTEQAILLGIGALLIIFSMFIFGVLAAGGILDALFGNLVETGRQYPPRGETSRRE